MQPIYVSIGLTAAAAGLSLFLIGPRLDFLSPYWGVILRDYWMTLTVHLGMALVTSIAVIYRLVRVLGLADLGGRVDLVERSIRRGEGDTDLQEALQRGDEGVYPDILKHDNTIFEVPLLPAGLTTSLAPGQIARREQPSVCV